VEGVKRASIATSRIFPIALTLLFSPSAVAADPVSIHIARAGALVLSAPTAAVMSKMLGKSELEKMNW
jgi:hypothetical protein